MKKYVHISRMPAKKRVSIVALALMMVLPMVGFIFFGQGSQTARAEETPWPVAPPAQVCGNSSILGNGPTAAPEGAVVVPAGDNIDMFYDFRTPNTTFWFAPGEHTLGTDQYGQIQPGDNSVFVGAPGAVLDGKDVNKYAFTGAGQNVTIRYLTVQNFAAPQQEGVVNHNDGNGWLVEYNTIKDNGGAGMMLGGSDNTYRYNCVKDNGQYGINGCCGEQQDEVSNNTIDHNEISGNNTDDWETQQPGCGCTGGMKFWLNASGTITNNYIHGNDGVGIWLDNNNRNFRIEGNYITENHAEAIFVEAGYDTQIRYNNIKRNNIEPGQHRAANGDKFPIGAIYFSEAGSPAGYGLNFTPSLVSYNNFEDNWGGVILWESPDRYSGSTANTHSAGTVKIGDIYDTTTCDGADDTIPATVTNKYDCRWSTENIVVEHNDFSIDKAAVGANCDTTNYCGINGLFSSYGTYPAFPAYEIPTRITFQQGNIFRDNHYTGDWRFAGFDRKKMDGSRVTWSEWTAPAPQPPYNFSSSNYPASFGQDQGSTYDGPTTPPPSPVTPPPAAHNHLDNDSYNLESSVGQWAGWYSANASRSADTAHTGTHSLKVDVTASNGWGVAANNWPGFAATAGTKRLSLWGKAGTGTAQQPKLTVKWLDGNYTVLQTDYATLPTLSNTWQQASVLVDAPAGTDTALVYLTGNESSGTSLYFDDIVVGNPDNALDADTAGLEGSAGHWNAWYSSSVSSSAAEAHDGTRSLLIDVTDPWGWAVSFNNWPGFAATPGAKRVSYWAKAGTGDVSSVTLRVKWLDASGAVLQTDLVPVSSLTTSWQRGTADITAPTGTASVLTELYSSSGSANSKLYVDDVLITK